MNKEEIQKLKDILWANTWDNEQIIKEGISTLQNSFNLQDEGFRRVESAGLLAIYTLQHQLEEKEKVIDDLQKPFIFLKNRVNQGISKENLEQSLIKIGKNIIENLEGGKNEET